MPSKWKSQRLYLGPVPYKAYFPDNGFFLFTMCILFLVNAEKTK